MKTYKRETAWGALGFLGANAAAAYGLDSATAIRILEITTVPIFTFAGAMFSADWVGKQTSWANLLGPKGPQRTPEVELD